MSYNGGYQQDSRLSNQQRSLKDTNLALSRKNEKIAELKGTHSYEMSRNQAKVNMLNDQKRNLEQRIDRKQSQSSSQKHKSESKPQHSNGSRSGRRHKR